ncbi:unnamed protein product [Polarella glacialis]|uniref:Uncharacterized protein n=1 Tax=Polarella glacialis TaxID=89957 RepID=A0A813G0Z4_POLGL|nr:unnamed protein product [Polarella glacialis]
MVLPWSSGRDGLRMRDPRSWRRAFFCAAAAILTASGLDSAWPNAFRCGVWRKQLLRPLAQPTQRLTAFQLKVKHGCSCSGPRSISAGNRARIAVCRTAGSDSDGSTSEGTPGLAEVLRRVASPGLLLAASLALAAGARGGCVSSAASVGACAVLGAALGQRTAFGRAMTGPVCAMALGVLASQIVPAQTAVLQLLQRLVVSLATPLLLLSCNLREVMGASTRRLLIAFVLGSFSTFLAATASCFLLRRPLLAACGDWENVSKVVAALAAKNIGSGMNFVAVSQALHMQPALVAASLAADSALGLAYFPVAASLTPSSGAEPLLAEDDSSDHSRRSRPSGNSWRAAAFTLLTAASIAIAAEAVALPGYSYIVSSAFAVALAVLPWGASLYPSGELLGWPLLYLYFASAGFTAGSVEATALAAYCPLLVFGVALYGFHLFFLLLGGRLLGLSRGELMVASSANIGGPATASSLAMAKGLQELSRPAVLVGTVGNAVGTPLGVLMFRALLAVGRGIG